MSKLSLLTNALRWRASPLNPARRLPLRRFSTEGEQQPQPPPSPPPQDPSPLSTEGEQQQQDPSPLSTEGEQQQQDPSVDPFLQTPGEGWVFGRLTGIGRNTMKTDIIHFFEGCNLSTTDVKVEYNKAYTPVCMMLQFSSRSSFDAAVRQTIRKGRLHKLDKVDRSQWDLTTSYDGKTVLLQGLPRNALPEDIERFLCGCNFDPSSFQIFIRYTPETVRFALVQFHTRIAAMNALCVRNRGFCLNNPITMRVLH